MWQGREISWATRLYYFRARWYEPITGRWLSNDPIGISGGLNQYVFCGDDPVNFVDPLGLCEDGEKYVQDYTKALKKNPYSWPYVRSVVNEYDIKLADELSHIDRTWSFRGEKYKSDVMGNIAPAYAATMVYGPIVSPVLMVGAEIMYDRPKGISAKIKAATGSFKMNAVGIKEAVKDTIKDMFGAR